MRNSTVSHANHFAEDSEVWASLKQAIARSSGFQSWYQEHTSQWKEQQIGLDEQVRCYLRETLETLAY